MWHGRRTHVASSWEVHPPLRKEDARHHLAELDAGAGREPWDVFASLGLAAERECRTGSGASTLPGALDDHERYVIVESTTRPVCELSQCRLNESFGRSLLDV